MAKTRKPPKPIFPIKHEFVDALDNFIQKAQALDMAVRMVLEHGNGKLPEALLSMMQKAHDDFSASWSED